MAMMCLQTTNSTDPAIQMAAGFSAHECYGAVLIWNNGSLGNIDMVLKLLEIPYASFTVDVFQLDPDNMPQACPMHHLHMSDHA